MNPPGNASSPLDRMIHSPLTTVAAFAWGLAEATWFFIVPDVLLTLIGCRSLRVGFKASAAALAGAVIGGVFMYLCGNAAPETVRSWLTRVPGIHPPLIERVQKQLNDRGFSALLLGPTMGIPYKIYAAECGARRDNLTAFVLVSLPARGIRFVLSVLIASAVARAIAPWTKRRAKVELTVLAAVWTAFYVFYFMRFSG